MPIKQIAHSTLRRRNPRPARIQLSRRIKTLPKPLNNASITWCILPLCGHETNTFTPELNATARKNSQPIPNEIPQVAGRKGFH